MHYAARLIDRHREGYMGRLVIRPLLRRDDRGGVGFARRCNVY